MLLYIAKKPRPRRERTLLKAAVELHLFAILLFSITAAALFFAEPSPPVDLMLRLSLAAYATAFLCVAADRATR
ncbi:hypothetical protein ACFS7Z_15655 [Pontibacter toksunensis]|uniref:Uncharacterized protein n=1 Tax=Pontibacter toksunensis TaxID=1332631 RepID=A0ABW6BXW3_9BACT